MELTAILSLVLPIVMSSGITAIVMRLINNRQEKIKGNKISKEAADIEVTSAGKVMEMAMGILKQVKQDLANQKTEMKVLEGEHSKLQSEYVRVSAELSHVREKLAALETTLAINITTNVRLQQDRDDAMRRANEMASKVHAYEAAIDSRPSIVAGYTDDRYANLLFYRCPLPVSYVDRDGRFLHVNNAWCEWLGYNEKELQSKAFADITHHDDIDGDFAAAADEMINSHRDSYTMRKRYITKEGIVVWFTLVVYPIRTYQGEFAHFITFAIPDNIPGIGSCGECKNLTNMLTKSVFAHNVQNDAKSTSTRPRDAL